MQQVVQICNLNSLIFRTECTRICTKTTGAQGSVCVGAAEGDGGEGFSEKVERAAVLLVVVVVVLVEIAAAEVGERQQRIVWRLKCDKNSKL